MSSLIAKHTAYKFEEKDTVTECHERTHKMLFQCLQAMNAEQEQSGPQIVSYLMGWSDQFLSHHFVPLYWSGMKGQLLQWFPSLKQKQ